MQPSDIQAAWQSQPSQLSPQVIERMNRSLRTLKRERLASLLGMPFLLAVTLVFTAAAIFAEGTLVSVGCAIFAASWAYTMVRILRIDWAPDATSDCVTHHRAHLILRRDTFRNFPLWSGLPATVGVALATFGWYLSEPNRIFDVFMPAAFWAGLQIAFWAGHQTRIARIQKQIDTLDAA